jgi:sterol desaturase/sphingolipid hydroxylase (fatty acid hydroxylase superfamily)
MLWNDYINYWIQIGSRYFMVAGIAFIVYYFLFRRRNQYKKIQNHFPAAKDYIREIIFSILTVCIFALVPLLILKVKSISVHTRFYTDIGTHGRLYFFLAFPLMFFIHDTYFYWTHRLMHHRSLFKTFHLLHHRSTNPSPWAAYAFHPLEAIVEAGIFAVFLFTIPIHYLHLFIFFFLMIVYNVYGHLGYELYPKGFSKHPIGKWINTSVSHNQHHQFFKGNYGLYFTFWDRMMGTQRDDYSEKFESIASLKRKESIGNEQGNFR